MQEFSIITVNPDNILQEKLFCVKDITNPGFKKKQEWFLDRFKEGLRLKMIKDSTGKPIAFIEYIPSQSAWRPLEANNYLFVQCMFVYSNKDKMHGVGSRLLAECEIDARENKFYGVCSMTSDGSWISDKRLFLKNGYHETGKRGRFELLVKKMDHSAPDPVLLDWELQQSKYQGWHIVYANQCPWHEKAVNALLMVAKELNFELTVTRLKSSEEARNAPSGFGVFSLLHNGRLLEDHYISETRFRSIARKELGR